MNRPIVAVLAGGDSTRMGFDKAMARIGESTMLELVVQAAGQVGDVVVVGRPDAPGGAPAVPDRRNNARGPLAGLDTVLHRASQRPTVLVAVDHPFVRPRTLRALLELEGDAVVPVDAGWQQVTCAVYRPGFLRSATAVLERGDRSIITALDGANTRLVQEPEWRAWGEDGRSWFSVDSLDRLEEGLRRFG
jgi:molybdopterin-guanine dinucleotide biosynthesis protein A